MKFETINVTKEYVKQLINSEDFKKYVVREAYEDVFNEKYVVVEEKDCVITYSYVIDGDVAFKNTFYCSTK